MKQKLLVAALLAGSLSVAHAEDQWAVVAASDTATHSVKIETFDLQTNRSGDEVVTVIGKTENSDKTINVYKLYVRTADCQAGYGKLVTLSTDGTFQFDNDFASGSGNVGSAKAEAVCYFYKLMQEAAAGKSL